MQRKDGRWQILIRHTDADGVRKRMTATGKTAKESRQRAEEVRARLKKELPARDTRQLVDQYAETWSGVRLSAAANRQHAVPGSVEHRVRVLP